MWYNKSMNNLLARYLEKLGYKSIDELSDVPMPDNSPTEKNVFQKWQKILSSNEDVTVDNIKELCERQLSQIEEQMKDLENSDIKNNRLVILHTVYKTILKAISSPITERAQLEVYLNSLLTQK